MQQRISQRRQPRKVQAGMTLLELIIACGILVVLSSAAIPLARVTVKRQRETELRRNLREMRDAIDSYKIAADHHQIRLEIGSEGYPPDLETLTTGVAVSIVGASQVGISAATLAAQSSTAQGAGISSPSSTSDIPQKVRFLRKILVDPTTGKAEWGLRAVQDDADSQSWGGHNVFDVYSLSTDTAMDGTKYADW